MENLHGGILIATTNMAANMDKGFDRRFLYKLEDCAAAAAIWQSRLPDLAADDAEALSARYDFSGGQIENIVRKQCIGAILNGNPLTLDGLAALCDEELLGKGAKRIGFCAD